MSFSPLFVPITRGSLDYARDDGTLLRVDTRVDINPSRDFRYTLKRSICAVALDMPKGVMVIKIYRHFDQVKRVEKSPNEWYEQGQTKKYLLFPPQRPLGHIECDSTYRTL